MQKPKKWLPLYLPLYFCSLFSFENSFMTSDCCLQLYLMLLRLTHKYICNKIIPQYLLVFKECKALQMWISLIEKRETAEWANPCSDRIFQKLWFNATSNVWCCVSIPCIASIMCRDSCCLVSQSHLFISCSGCTWPKFILRMVAHGKFVKNCV